MSGYAWSGGGQKIIRVDVTSDKGKIKENSHRHFTWLNFILMYFIFSNFLHSSIIGKTWHTANLTEDLKAKQGRYWSWTLWNVELPVEKNHDKTEIWVKAVDASYNTQPENFKNIYNLRGLLCNAYHKITIKLN